MEPCGQCKTYFTCGRGQNFPQVDHSSEKCALSYLECIQQHYRHECAHDFTSGPWVEDDLGGTASCRCGLTAMAHDWSHAP